MRIDGKLPDDPLLHACALTFASDLTLLDSVLSVHGEVWGPGGMIGASLDHALWFHRPFRADEWFLYDCWSPSASGARGLATGRMFTVDGRAHRHRRAGGPAAPRRRLTGRPDRCADPALGAGAVRRVRYYALRFAGSTTPCAPSSSWRPAARRVRVTAERLATAQEIPPKFLESILLQLRRGGIVNAQRGPEGGYWLARPADEISLAEVIRVIDGPLANVRGQRPEELGYQGAAAALQEVWIALRASEREILELVTFADVVPASCPAGRDAASPTRAPGV